MRELVTLFGRDSAYVVDTRGNGMPRCVYWGPRGSLASGDVELTESLAQMGSEMLAPAASLDEPVRLNLMPESGLGFFGQPALLGAREQRDWATSFAVAAVDHRRDARELTIVLRDDTAGLELQLEIAMDGDSDVLARRCTLTNVGAAGEYTLTWLAAAAWQLPSSCHEAQLYHGAWAAEWQHVRVRLDAGVHLREARRSRSGHDGFPGLIAGSAGFGETTGLVYGVTLGWSGAYRLLVETTQEGPRQAQLGTLLAPGELVLSPGTGVTTPWCYGAMSTAGLNELSARWHAHARSRLLPRAMRSRPRPVHLNTWEAVYFDHRIDALVTLAERAAKVGVERFVLDDGWFRGRRSDRTALGDWYVDPVLYPDGIGPLIDAVHGHGMTFGLWVEPEMISPDSDLYRAHPEWVARLPNRAAPQGRHQWCLDLTISAVEEWLFGRLDALLSAYRIDYVKWDYNRDLAPATSSIGRPSGIAQVQAFYRLLDRLRSAHPGVEFEGCASGGGRIDYELMRRVERFWTSDNADALDRQRIQYAMSVFFPLEVMGAHVGPSPCHVTGRSSSLAFRAGTALFGHMGLELDLGPLAKTELDEVRQHVAVYKRWRGLLHSGRLHRFDLGDATGHGFIVVSQDETAGAATGHRHGSEALAALIRMTTAPHPDTAPVKLPGLDESARYRVTVLDPVPARAGIAELDAWRAGREVSGQVIARQGLPLSSRWPETIVLVSLQRI